MKFLTNNKAYIFFFDIVVFFPRTVAIFLYIRIPIFIVSISQKRPILYTWRFLFLTNFKSIRRKLYLLMSKIKKKRKRKKNGESNVSNIIGRKSWRKYEHRCIAGRSTTLASKRSRFGRPRCMSHSTNTRRVDVEQGPRGGTVVLSLYRAKVILAARSCFLNRYTRSVVCLILWKCYWSCSFSTGIEETCNTEMQTWRNHSNGISNDKSWDRGDPKKLQNGAITARKGSRVLVSATCRPFHWFLRHKRRAQKPGGVTVII